MNAREDTKMKKQINSNIQAHLLQSTFYVLLLLTVCAIPFALAQRNATEQSVAELSSASRGLPGVGNALPATIIVVTNTNDSGPGSLRQALADANDGDTINFDSSLNGQKITLTSGELNVDKDVTITGPGADNLAVDGNAQSLVFYVNPGKTVTVSGLTVENGYSDSPNGGSGIFNWNATLTVSNCTISGNSGGGIGNVGFRGSATLTITNCTVSGNSATAAGNGGGIGNVAEEGDAVLTVSNSTISGNSAGVGGGIGNGANPGYAMVTISNCTISDNSADYSGGGILNACSVGGTSGVTVSNSTLSGNSATGNGGGIYNAQGGATVELSNTILNTGSSGENIFNMGGTVTSLGYNLSSDNGGGYLTGAGDQINTDPVLGPLEDNGGPTFTHALLPGSPAIDAGDPKFIPPPYYDQRGPGFDRVVNGRIDIGSFETQGPTPTPRPSPTSRPRPTPAPRP
jgi:hypothetical protein